MNKLVKIKRFIFYTLFKLHEKGLSDVKEIDRYINHFSEPRNLFERSYCQYLCQKKQYSNSKMYGFMYGCMNLFSAIIFILLLMIPEMLYKKVYPIDPINAEAVASFGRELDDRIPDELRKDYDTVRYMDARGMLISPEEKKFIVSLWKQYPFSFNFLLKNFLKVGTYKYMIESAKKNIKVIIASCEYSYTSSVLTQFCRNNNIKHINIMHGEMVTQLAKTFYEFDKFFIWDDYYTDLSIKRMRASERQFNIAVPKCLLFDVTKSEDKVSYKYYLQNQNSKQMIQMKSILTQLTDDFKVRPHPLYSDMKAVEAIFDSDQIETGETTIEDSIMEAAAVVAWDSTVLFQAYLNGKRTIIDDITNRERYMYSVDGGYIMTNKSEKLSNLVEMRR